MTSAGLLGLAASSGCAGARPSGSSDLASGDDAARDLAGVAVDLARLAGTDLAVATDLLVPPGGDLAAADLVAIDDLAGASGRGAGENCDQDADCASRLCRGVLVNGMKVCVTLCKSQNDCKVNDLYCHPLAAGGGDGYCVPRSPTHCTSCSKDADCGILSERCLKAPGDVALACHIDCALAGAAACPPDYDCAAVQDGNDMRKLCVPKNGVCLDANGGYCERVALPQPCARTNLAGSCSGKRECMLNTRRFGDCNAKAPQFKLSCLDQDPAGCMVAYAPAAISTKQNCGMCGKACAMSEDCCNMVCMPINTPQACGACGKTCNGGDGCCNLACTPLSTPQDCGGCGKKCPGLGLNSADALCANQQCDLTCRGENYDVDADPANGCERFHGNTPGHSLQSATGLGDMVCNDEVTKTISGQLYSDARLHNPAPEAFDAKVGSSPDFWSVVGTGKSKDILPCANDYVVTFTVAGGGNMQCYRCTITTDKVTNSVTISGNATGSMKDASLSRYSSGKTIYFKVEKICDTKVREAVTYSIKFNL